MPPAPDTTPPWSGTASATAPSCSVEWRNPQAAADGVPQQDTWEWDPATSNWTLRTTTGSMPSPRWGHAMAYDPGRGMTVLTGGKDFQTYTTLADVWDWDPATGEWTQRLSGSEQPPCLPRACTPGSSPILREPASIWCRASLSTRLFGSGETNRLPPRKSGNWSPREPPSQTARLPQCATPAQVECDGLLPGHGQDLRVRRLGCKGAPLDDLWEWDGSSWALVKAAVRPSARAGSAMAYDPIRKSLLVFGGGNDFADQILCDTWEWQSGTESGTSSFPRRAPLR